MFDIWFGWRKASKCKKLMKKVQDRIKLLKNKRRSIVRQLREDVAQLIRIGYEDIALQRAEHLFKDENIVAIYELLDNFCEFIIIHLSYIRRHKDCPNDINEAVSTLIFASARCGDLPELRLIRKLFGERYGQGFEMTALELLPGNLVNLQVKEKLSIMSVPDYEKRRLVDEISRDYCLRPEILALEFTSEQQQQVKQDSRAQILATEDEANGSRSEGPQQEDSDANRIEGKAIYVDSASSRFSLPSHQNSDMDMIRTSVSSSTVQQSSADVLENLSLNREEKAANITGLDRHEFAVVAIMATESQITGRTYTATSEHKGERTTKASSSESLPLFPEEMIVYLDDVEEVRSSITKEGNSQDQRIFKFKSSLLKNEKLEDRCDLKHGDLFEDGSWNEKSSSTSPRQRPDASRKRSRRRSLSQEHISVKDVECVTYYDKPYKRYNHASHLRSKLHKNHSVDKSIQSCQVEKREGQPDSTYCLNLETDECYLTHPCRFCSFASRDDQVVQPWQKNRGVTVIHSLGKVPTCKIFHHFHCSASGESDTEMEWYIVPQKPRRSCEFHAISYDLSTNPECQSHGKREKMKGKLNKLNSAGSQVTSNDSSPKASSPLTRKETKLPYLRAKTMPQERTKVTQPDNVLRTKSFPLPSPKHVHPKLPDYDDLTAQFMALKKRHLQNSL